MNPRDVGGSVNRYRVPTLLERAGDFSQSLDNLGALYPYIKDPLISGTCSAANTTACFKDGGVLGRPVGLAVANDGALLFTEDGNNTLWRISYTGTAAAR